ncbi:MAG TPA: aminoglycoside phosphotransferase family protein [Nocardioidaceae bacterium]|nr:aminoglycoside phosphotransferase family protein [Nocardioidaceae bacterium]
MSDDPQSPNIRAWSAGAFIDEVTGWVEEAATGCGIALTGEREQPHLRSWSSAVRFGAVGCDLWFKVNGPGTRHEAALLGALAQVEPDLVPDVLAVDRRRGWTLMRDAGPVLRAVADPEAQWEIWPAVVGRYAEAQLRLADQPEAVLGTGVPLMTPDVLPGRLRTLVAELSSLPVEGGGLSAEERSRFAARFGEYDDWCAALAASDVPCSLQHDDLHSGNVCWGGTAEAARVIDWGDASWGFPLATMLVTLSSLAWAAGCPEDDPRVLRVRDSYLEHFSGYAAREDLVRDTDHARRTGCVTRAVSWRSALEGEPESSHREYGFPVRAWLLELLET